MKRIAPIIQIGDIFDDMQVVEELQYKKGKCSRYIVKCLKCGRMKEADRSVLLLSKGTTHRSCGKGIKLKDIRFYSLWKNMRSRTTNPLCDNYEFYGGRGINSDEFADFIDFYDAMYASYLEAYKKFGK